MTELADILDAFEYLTEWDDRYQYLIELGEALPTMPDDFKTEDNRVKPCMSTVHVHARCDDDGRIQFDGDCDTAIIKGVLALLIELFNDKTPAEIDAISVDELFDSLKLADHLSPNRHVGIYAIVEVMKEQARTCSNSSPEVA